MAKVKNTELIANAPPSDWSWMCRMAGWAAFLLIAYSFATILQIVILGGPPATAAEAFSVLQHHRVVGLLRLDLPTMFVMPLYYLLLLGLFAAVQSTDRAKAILATALGYAGLTLVLATPTALPMLSLSNRYAAATTETAKLQLLAAGEGVLASDIWHGTGALIGGILLQASVVLICVIMLRSKVFSKAIAYLGILAYALDLAHLLLKPFVPLAGTVLMAISGPLYPIWFFLVGRRLFQLASMPSHDVSPFPIESLTSQR